MSEREPKPQSIDEATLKSQLKDMRGLLDANRDLMTNEEYLASLVTLNGVEIAIERSKNEG